MDWVGKSQLIVMISLDLPHMLSFWCFCLKAVRIRLSFDKMSYYEYGRKRQ